MSDNLSPAELVQLVKKDPKRVIETIKTQPYDESIFRDIHGAVMQVHPSSSEWKILRNANFYEFYQTVLLSDQYEISSPTWIQVAKLQADYYKRDLSSHGNNAGPIEQMTLLINRVDTIRRIDEFDIIRNSTTDLPMLLDISRITALVPDPFKTNAVHLLPPVNESSDIQAIQSAFVRVLGMQRNTLAKIPYQKWIWLKLVGVTQMATEWPSMGDDALEILLDLVWESIGDSSKAGPSDRKNSIELLGCTCGDQDAYSHIFFERQGEHIFPMLSRLVLTDTKVFANITEKAATCKRLQASMKLQMSRCPESTKKQLQEQMMPIFLPVLFKLRSLANSNTNNPQTKLASDTAKAWAEIGEYSRLPGECVQDLKDKSGGLTALGMMRCARCKKKQYCDERCQHRDWTEGKHKEECKPA
ncbi:MYND Zn-finger protein [Rhizoctonia solani]|uniref:MYND Zn-finger protein n=1 Tax=Rhizoctonia solani TaxID=456999 RepID=A0A8H8T3C0_9AGAM|nr:MYND Zn-finger protein [Rhizoctonia solani]QRW27099.1 MYND Zn-finger protein [Rhizoctonia solani]